VRAFGSSAVVRITHELWEVLTEFRASTWLLEAWHTPEASDLDFLAVERARRGLVDLWAQAGNVFDRLATQINEELTRQRSPVIRAPED
jgi:hypothetical protein